MILWKNIIKQYWKRGKNNMWKCYLKNLEKDYTFEKYFDSQYLMNKFLTKVRYSKRLRLVGKIRVY